MKSHWEAKCSWVAPKSIKFWQELTGTASERVTETKSGPSRRLWTKIQWILMQDSQGRPLIADSATNSIKFQQKPRWISTTTIRRSWNWSPTPPTVAFPARFSGNSQEQRHSKPLLATSSEFPVFRNTSTHPMLCYTNPLTCCSHFESLFWGFSSAATRSARSKTNFQILSLWLLRLVRFFLDFALLGVTTALLGRQNFTLLALSVHWNSEAKFFLSLCCWRIFRFFLFSFFLDCGKNVSLQKKFFFSFLFFYALHICAAAHTYRGGKVGFLCLLLCVRT